MIFGSFIRYSIATTTVGTNFSRMAVSSHLSTQAPPASARSRDADFWFKHFKLAHHQSALRICTDSCIFGAFVAQQLAPTQPKRVLDVGSGCGLLAVMVAQKTQATTRIEAVEIDAASAEECAYNFRESPWAERMEASHCPVQEFAESADRQRSFDVILSNPPFYPSSNYSNGKDSRRNQALRTDSLSFSDLLQSIAALLSPEGTFYVLLPPVEAAELAAMADSHALVGHPQMIIRDQPSTEPHRTVYSFHHSSPAVIQTEPIHLCIKTPTLEYSDEFKQLLEDYYLPEHLSRIPGQKIGHPRKYTIQQ